MDKILIDTEQNIALDYPIASIGERILAWIIDVAIQFTYLLVVIWILNGALRIIIEEQYIFYILAMLPFLFYHLLFEIFFNGRSPGKMALKMKVVTLDGTRPAVSGYFIRWFFRLLDTMAGSGLVAVISYLMSDKGQRIGDRLAGTTVIKVKKIDSMRQKINFQVDPNYVIRYPEVQRLHDHHISLINEILGLPVTQKKYALAGKISKKIKTNLNITTDEPDMRFLTTLVKDYYHHFAGNDTSST